MSAQARTAQVVFQPDVHTAFLAGVRTLTRAIRPTIGTQTRHVAIAPEHGGGPPELLDSGGLIARRLLALPNRHEDIGAMFLRNLLWRVQSQTGDGTATASILFHTAFESGLRYLTAGGNAMRLRECLHRELQRVLDDLDRQTAPLTGLDQLQQVASTICPDRKLANAVAETHHLLGKHGRIEIRKSRRQELEIDQIEGNWWEGPVHSPEFLTNRNQRRIDLPRCHLLVTDLNIEDPSTLIPLLQQAHEIGVTSLALIVNTMSDLCISNLLANRHPGQFDIVAVKTPGVTATDRSEILTDLASASGAIPLHAAAGNRIDGTTVSRLGTARRFWADRTHFGIIGGGGDPPARREHLKHLELALDQENDEERRKILSTRIGNLFARSAVIRIGDVHESRRQRRIDQATDLDTALRFALLGGTVPGGGLALLAARTALSPDDPDDDTDTRAARAILHEALAAPISQILYNTGHHAPLLLGNADALKEVLPSGLRDAATTVRTAVRVAIEGAAQALTIDTVVHRRDPEESMHP
jgi:chaperonin GroEL